MKNALYLWTRMVLLFFITFSYSVYGADCRRTGAICVDASAVKNIQGMDVDVSQVGGCWEYEDTYECVGVNQVNYCSAISGIAGCNQVSSICSQYAFNGVCLNFTNMYRCGDAISSAHGAISLDNTYTVTTDSIDRSACATHESNPSCALAAKVCVEPGGTKIIDGLPVEKDCWKWEETYSCIAQNYQNYCIPLRQTTGCSEVTNTCKSYAWNNVCNEYERTYRCDGKQDEPLPQSVNHLNIEYTITKDHLNTSQCDPHKANPNCTLASHTCTQPGGTRKINGLDVYKDCWEWSDEYVCASTEMKSDCADLRNNNACSEKSTICLDALPAGQCGLFERKFECKVKDGNTQEVITCDNGVCVNGMCSAPKTNPDNDFGKAITGLEAVRQMGDYFDPATQQLFKGTSASCSVKLGGLGNCCKAKGGGDAQANNFMMQGVKMVGNEAVRFIGSSYMYDALYSTDLIPTSLLSSLYGPETILQSGSEYQFGSGGGLSFYGVTYIPGASPPFAFDPTSFAIAIAIQVATRYLQCGQEEQLLGLRKDQRLCTPVGSWCSQKVFGACMKKDEGYCCYNSRLSRIVNEQGRSQIGKSYGDPSRPDCSGFTTDEIERLDFSRMDLSEFIQEIVPKDLNQTLLNNRAQQLIEQRSNNYFNNPQYKH